MDPRNRFHTATTYWIVRIEQIVLLVVCTAVFLWHWREVNWWRAVIAFSLIDVVGYIPGAFAFHRSKDGRVNRWFHNFYNITHTYLVSGAAVAIWAYFTGGLEWAMLAVPIHLAGDRGLFGNTLKPSQLSFEPRDHSDDVVLEALGRRGDAGSAAVIERVPREVLTDVVEHPSGYLAVNRRNSAFTVADVPGFIAYRKQGRHLWLFGGVHARTDNAGPLLDRFLAFAAEEGYRVGAVQVRQSQVELFASRGFTVNQMGTTYAVGLKGYSFGGGKKMQLRNKIQKARRDGLRVVELGKDVPRDPQWFAKLEEVSARWLAAKGKKELDFMIGELGTPEDEDRRIFLVLDKDEAPIAFITYVPVWGSERPGYLHDLTRRVPEAPSGTMELCNAEAIERFKTEGAQYLHFGFTPFLIDDEAAAPASRWVHRMIHWLRKYGKKLYPVDSQAAYKTKWGTDIVEREYVAARPISFRTVFDLMALTRSI
jgi:hypothetical protein